MRPEVLSLKALNRALLARQHLLDRTDASVPAVVAHLVGLQAQEPKDPYIALWSRIQNFEPGDLETLVEAGDLVRLTLMRGTIHLVTADDAVALRPLVQPVLERFLLSRRRGFAGADLAAVAEEGHSILTKEPMTYAELGKRLGQKWPNQDPEALSRVVQVRVPLIQVPPRGLWRRSGAARHTPLDVWVKAKPYRALDVDRLLPRYLAAFGPASVRDAQAWCGLSKLAAVMERLGEQVDRFAAPDGTALYDVPSAPRPDADVAAPPRFLPVYENLVLGLQDRSRLLAPRMPRFPSNTFVRFVLIDGIFGATWKWAKSKDQATLHVDPFVRISKADRAAIREEGDCLLDTFAPDARSRSVRIGAITRV